MEIFFAIRTSYLANKSESGIYTIHNWTKQTIFDLCLVKIHCYKWIQIGNLNIYVYIISHL